MATFKGVLRVLVRLMMVVCLNSCYAYPEEAQPGTCAINCSNSKVGPISAVIAPLAPGSIDLLCQEVGPLPGPIQVKYRIYEKLPNSGGGDDDDGDEGDGGDGGVGSQVSNPSIIALPGVAFEPWLVGSVASSRTNDEHRDGDEIRPYKYAGIVTPRAEWCSDSCGIMTYEFVPNCVQGATNLITAGIVVHGAPPESFTSINVINAN